jgi:hypothetical protein
MRARRKKHCLPRFGCKGKSIPLLSRSLTLAIIASQGSFTASFLKISILRRCRAEAIAVSSGQTRGVDSRGTDGRFCEGFRMTAHRDDSACTGAVVRKPPVKERAGDEVPTVRQALW